jgi:hypothetical protein
LVSPEEPLPPAGPGHRPLEPSSIEFDLPRRIARTEIPLLCDHARALLVEEAAERLVCNARAVHEPDAVTVDALARLQLTALRLGRRVRLDGASAELIDLLAFMGLTDIVPPNDAERRASGGRHGSRRGGRPNSGK